MKTPIDLSQIPAPNIIEALDYEVIFTNNLNEFKSKMPEYSALVESDPIYKLIEATSFREFILRGQVNHACKSVMLAYAAGTDLDNLGAINNILRLTGETDTALRKRIQMSPEGYSVAGPEGAYIFHALSADGRVKDIKPTSPVPGDVVVVVLSNIGNGIAPNDLCDIVFDKLSQKTIRPLGDNVSVISASIVNYTINAEISFYSGPDRQIILDECETAINQFVQNAHKIGYDINISAIHAALHRSGVQNVNLISPTNNIIIADTQVGYCTAITLTDGGIDE